jgi:hypothetical protein
MTTRQFEVFAPVALAGIGHLPDTVQDRSIVIRLRRRSSGEPVEKLRRRTIEPEAAELRDWIAAWVADNTDALREHEPATPDALPDRATDVWEPLFSIADHADGQWAESARAAALELSSVRLDEAQSLGLRLLRDLAQVFGDNENAATESLLERLCALEESPWADVRGKQLDARTLARLLRPYDVRPQTVRVGDKTIKGYKRTDMADVWERYLSTDPPVTSDTSVTSTFATRDVTDVTDVTPRAASESSSLPYEETL